ncbi:hypothetical protein PR202_gb10974 [Eleusine coracana subsp. coracana]|uniref:Uncharacterized protein n=1 Tax=Eleusine coracana subsp. coracana TaxID=191504 RepID=A0AAV5ELV0_ELECO|nr:hypothetical protein PR202_gb10974 [Eleusine coracana subsp. coracana]
MASARRPGHRVGVGRPRGVSPLTIGARSVASKIGAERRRPATSSTKCSNRHLPSLPPSSHHVLDNLTRATPALAAEELAAQASAA